MPLIIISLDNPHKRRYTEIIVATNPVGYTKIFSCLAYHTLKIPNTKAMNSNIMWAVETSLYAFRKTQSLFSIRCCLAASKKSKSLSKQFYDYYISSRIIGILIRE
jgi:hypothetical protein